MKKANPETVLKILELWNDERKSSGVIADELGMTRSAVSGILHRQRLAGARVAAGRKPLATKPMARGPNRPKVAPELPPPPVDGIGIFELQKRSCRWPLPNARYCGAVTQEPPYCTHHSAIAYVTPLRK